MLSSSLFSLSFFISSSLFSFSFSLSLSLFSLPLLLSFSLFSLSFWFSSSLFSFSPSSSLFFTFLEFWVSFLSWSSLESSFSAAESLFLSFCDSASLFESLFFASLSLSEILVRLPISELEIDSIPDSLSASLLPSWLDFWPSAWSLFSLSFEFDSSFLSSLEWASLLLIDSFEMLFSIDFGFPDDDNEARFLFWVSSSSFDESDFNFDSDFTSDLLFCSSLSFTFNILEIPDPIKSDKAPFSGLSLDSFWLDLSTAEASFDSFCFSSLSLLLLSKDSLFSLFSFLSVWTSLSLFSLALSSGFPWTRVSSNKLLSSLFSCLIGSSLFNSFSLLLFSFSEFVLFEGSLLIWSESSEFLPLSLFDSFWISSFELSLLPFESLCPLLGIEPLSELFLLSWVLSSLWFLISSLFLDSLSLFSVSLILLFSSFISFFLRDWDKTSERTFVIFDLFSALFDSFSESFLFLVFSSTLLSLFAFELLPSAADNCLFVNWSFKMSSIFGMISSSSFLFWSALFDSFSLLLFSFSEFDWFERFLFACWFSGLLLSSFSLFNAEFIKLSKTPAEFWSCWLFEALSVLSLSLCFLRLCLWGLFELDDSLLISFGLVWTFELILSSLSALEGIRSFLLYVEECWDCCIDSNISFSLSSTNISLVCSGFNFLGRSVFWLLLLFLFVVWLSNIGGGSWSFFFFSFGFWWYFAFICIFDGPFVGFWIFVFVCKILLFCFGLNISFSLFAWLEWIFGRTIDAFLFGVSLKLTSVLGYWSGFKIWSIWVFNSVWSSHTWSSWSSLCFDKGFCETISA